MMATFLLVIRTALSIVLYLFLGWAFYLLWRDLRSQAQRVSTLQTPPLVLAFIGPDGEELRQFTHSPITIGRDAACDFRLDEPTVSTRHAVLSYHHSQWWVEDLDSTNGTLLNGQPVDEAAVLTTSDEVRCGQVDLRVLITLGEGSIQPIKNKGDFQSE